MSTVTVSVTNYDLGDLRSALLILTALVVFSCAVVIHALEDRDYITHRTAWGYLAVVMAFVTAEAATVGLWWLALVEALLALWSLYWFVYIGVQERRKPVGRKIPLDKDTSK